MTKIIKSGAEEITTIGSDGTIGGRGERRTKRREGDDNDHHGNGHGRRNEDDEERAPRPAQGAFVIGDGDQAGRVEGDRESVRPEAHFSQRTLSALRNVVTHLLVDKEHFPPNYEAHYQRVVSALATEVAVSQETRDLYQKAQEHLEKIGDSELAGGVKGHYHAELTKAFLVLDEFSQVSIGEQSTPARLEQEKALLIFAECMLVQYQRQSADSDIVRSALAFDLAEQIDTLRISDENKTRLGEAINAVQNNVAVSYITCWDKVVQPPDHYIRPDSSDVVQGDVRLDPLVVREHLRLSSQNSEGAFRLLIGALDGLDPHSQEQRVETRTKNPEVVLSPDDPLMGWQARVEAQLGHALEGQDHINGCLGAEKQETKLFGFKGQHENKHVIKNVSHKAPIRKEGGKYEKLEAVEAAEITIKATVYQGEWRQGRTLEPGQSAPKEFFERLAEVTVWSVTLDSANKVENFHDQLVAAEAVVLDMGMQVTQVLGRFEGATGEAILKAKAFRIPVMDHRGQPSFVVVDRETMLEMQRVCDVSRRSYAKLAKQDPRYKADSREVRWAHFNPQLQEQQNTPENWIDQERDVVLVEGPSRERSNALRGVGGEVNNYIADQLDDAMGEYMREFNEFQMHYCRLSHYQELATARLRRRGLEAGAPDYQHFLDGEINAVAIEYMNRWNAFRSMTTRVMGMRPQEGAENAEILAMNAELDAFLANIDYELQIQVATASTDATEEDLRDALEPFMRTTTPPTINGHLLKNAFIEARTAYRAALPAGERRYGQVLRTLDTLLSKDDHLVQLANASPDAATVTTIRSDAEAYQASSERVSIVGARRAVEGLRSLNAGGDNSNVSIYRRNASFLKITDNLVKSGYPDSGVARKAMEQQRVVLEDLLDRSLTDVEMNRFLDNHPLVEQQRKHTIGRMQVTLEYAQGVRLVNQVLLDLTNGRTLLSEFTDDELAEYATVVNASVRALSALDLTKPQYVSETTLQRQGGGSSPLRIATEHPGQPTLDAMLITYENALNESINTPVLGVRIRDRFIGVMA